MNIPPEWKPERTEIQMLEDSSCTPCDASARHGRTCCPRRRPDAHQVQRCHPLRHRRQPRARRPSRHQGPSWSVDHVARRHRPYPHGPCAARWRHPQLVPRRHGRPAHHERRHPAARPRRPRDGRLPRAPHPGSGHDAAVTHQPPTPPRCAAGPTRPPRWHTIGTCPFVIDDARAHPVARAIATQEATCSECGARRWHLVGDRARHRARADPHPGGGGRRVASRSGSRSERTVRNWARTGGSAVGPVRARARPRDRSARGSTAQPVDEVARMDRECGYAGRSTADRTRCACAACPRRRSTDLADERVSVGTGVAVREAQGMADGGRDRDPAQAAGPGATSATSPPRGGVTDTAGCSAPG